MDDLKLFAKSKNQIDSFEQTLYILSKDTGMQFGIKCLEYLSWRDEK